VNQRGYAQLILIAIVAAAGAAAIWYVYEKGHDAGYAEAMIEIREIEKDQEKTEAAASTALEGDRVRTRTIYRTITKEVDRVVEKPVYLAACLDDDGMRLANAALAGALQPAREPDGGMPAAQPLGERDGRSGSAEAGGDR
jgi:hypothetical protein